MLIIYRYLDDFDQQDLPREKWKYDYYIIGLDKYIKRDTMPRVRPVHIWYSEVKDWHVQFCEKAYRVELIVKPRFRDTIERLKTLPPEVSFFYRILILFAFANYDEAKEIKQKYFGEPDYTLIKDDNTKA